MRTEGLSEERRQENGVQRMAGKERSSDPRTTQLLASGLPIGRMNRQGTFHVWTQESAARRGGGFRVQRGPAKGKGPPDIQGKVQGALKLLKDNQRHIQNFHSLLEQKLTQIGQYSI